MNRPSPDSRSRYAHFTAISTRWMDNDGYRHVNNVVYYSFFDTAVNQYLLAQGVLDLETSTVVCLVVDTGCSFFAPVSFPDVVHCGLRVAHLGASSVRYELGVFRNDDPRAAAQGHFVHVCCDRFARTPVPMPPLLRAALERLHLPRPPAGENLD